MSLKTLIDLDGLSRFKEKILALIPVEESDANVENMLDSFGLDYTAHIVTISLTNPSHPNKFGSFTIYEMLDDSTTGNVIGTIDSASGSTNISVRSNIYGIKAVLTGNGVWFYDTNITITGDITHVNKTGGGTTGPLIFSINGDGTITINGVNWDF